MITLIALAGGYSTPIDAAPGVTQVSAAGQPVTIEFRGPLFDENGTGNGNPFLDWRLLARVTQPDGRELVIPGYFAGDGSAAVTHVHSGRIWQVKFTPSQPGLHQYVGELHVGPEVAIDLDPAAGTPSTHAESFHGESGGFTVAPRDEQAPGFLGKGMLRYVGEHHLRFDDGSWYLKGGADSPENFLAFDGFDGTTGTHHFGPHAGDWQSGDPDWTDEDGDGGRNIIGALNYLASTGMNSVYFLTMNVAGDGNDVWPWTSPSARFSFDVSKLAQWEIVFSHMDRLGIQLHVVTQETENDHLLDGGELGVERRLYYKELVARFAHHNAVSWNLGEENRNTAQQRWDFSSYLAAWDVYDHPITVHHYPHEEDLVYWSMLGHTDFDGTSLQLNPGEIHDSTVKWIDASREAQQRWVVCHDEQVPALTGTMPDADDFWHDQIRKFSLWGNLIAGGAGVEYYFGYGHPNNDVNCEDWRSRAHMWELTRHALEFFQEHLPFEQMGHADELVTDGWCLALPGTIYAVYLPDGGTTTLDLQSDDGTFDVRWFDPRHGGALADGTVDEVTGPGLVNLGSAPNEPTGDWVVQVQRRQHTRPPEVRIGPDQRVRAGDTVQFHAKVSHQGGGDQSMLSFHWDFGDGSFAEDAGSAPVHAYAAPGVYPVILTVSNGVASDQDSLLVAVGTANLAVDHFEDGETHEWIGPPDMRSSAGRLQFSGGVANLTSLGVHGAGRVVASDVAAEVTLTLSGSGSGWGGLAIRRSDAFDDAVTSGYLAFLRSNGQLTLYVGGVGIIDSAWTGLDPTAAPVTLRLESVGERIVVYADGVPYLDRFDATFQEGQVALAGHHLLASFDDFHVESLAPFHAYGTGQLGSAGVLTASGSGVPMVTGNFRIRVAGIAPGSVGLLLRSTKPGGAVDVPFLLGDWFVLTAGVSRHSLKNASPSGVVEYDYSELEPALATETQCYQYWSRDGAETLLSNAVRVTFE